jgi:hypothetical protein
MGEHSWQYGNAPKAPTEQVRQGRAYLLDLMQSGLPGYPTDDRILQSQKFTGIVYTAIRPLMRAVRKADVTCLKRVKKRRNRTTFGPGSVVAKSTASYGKSQRDDYIPVDAGHPVARLLDRPQQKDGTETLGDVLEYGILQTCLTGVAPFWCVPAARYLERGEWRPVQLYALPTALCVPQPTRGPEYPAGLYRLTPYYASPTASAGWYQGMAAGVAGTLLDGREVKRRKLKHPNYLWDGYSPLTACAFLLDVAEAVDQARWAQMQHGINPSLFITANGLDGPAITALEENLKQTKGGARASRKVVVVSSPHPEGKIDVKTPTGGQQRLDYSDDWEQVQAAVLAVFGTPRTVAGLSTAAGYAELYAAKRQFHEMTVAPECEEIGDFLTAALAQPWEEEDGELFVEVVPDEPRNEETANIPAKDRLETGAWTVNEVRASQNSPPVPGGDVPLSVYVGKAGIDAGTSPDPTEVPEDGGKPGAKGGPTAGAPPRPENKAGKDTRPPTGKHAVTKALPPDTDIADPAPYGFCPECRTPGVMAERRINGNAHCANGHAYPRKGAKYASTQIELTGAAAKKLRAMARSIPDADLGEDGREDDPHVTARYGLHATGPEPVASAVSGFGPVRYRLGRLAAFRGAETGKDYDVIFAEVDSPDLHRLHAALGAVPHTDTWPTYKPHATVAYVRAGLADAHLARLGAVDTAGETDALTFSTADRNHTTVPLSAAIGKSMSSLVGSDGGALVPPATVGVARRKRRVLRNKAAVAFAERVIKGL